MMVNHDSDGSVMIIPKSPRWNYHFQNFQSTNADDVRELISQFLQVEYLSLDDSLEVYWFHQAAVIKSTDSGPQTAQSLPRRREGSEGGRLALLLLTACFCFFVCFKKTKNHNNIASDGLLELERGDLLVLAKGFNGEMLLTQPEVGDIIAIIERWKRICLHAL